MRIVSLLPSATEILYALGLGDSIIGISHDCDYPPDARRKPVVSSVAIPVGLSSASIDAAVQGLHAGASLYHIDLGFLRRQQPDLIIAQELCHVCAVTSTEARKAAEVVRSGAAILSLEPQNLAEVRGTIRTLGAATGRELAAEALASRLDTAAASLQTTLAHVRRPRVVCLGWLEPLIVEGHWLPEMVELAGGAPQLVQSGAPARHVEWHEVQTADPEALFLVPCSFTLARTVSEAHVLEKLPGWRELRAVRAGRVFALDSSYFSCAGPRLTTGLGILARCLHPESIKQPLPIGAAARLQGSSFAPVG